MSTKLGALIFVAVLVISVMMTSLTGCSTKTTSGSTTATAVSPGGPGGQAVINSDSVITAQIKSITKQNTGFAWQLDIMINSSQSVGSLPNPVEGKTGQVVTVKSEEDLSKYQVGDNISGKIKYVGDVPKPGITLLLYNVAKQTGGY